MWHWYGLVIGIAIAIGWSVAERIEPRVGKIVPWIVIGGLIGARAYHVIDLWGYYQKNPVQILALWNGGLGIWGGILGGIVAVLIYHSATSRREMWKVLSAIAVVMPLAQAIGRVANGVNGEFVNLIGVWQWWSVEAILDLGLFGILWLALRRNFSSKSKVGIYFVGYGVIRGVLERYREVSWEVGYIFVACAIIIGLWLLVVRD
ncbi:MAG: prolipoprotein diacylglyceryl transferase family protein [bacterium]